MLLRKQIFIYVGNLPEWKLASDHGVDDGEDDESLGGDAKADSDQIPEQDLGLSHVVFGGYQKHIEGSRKHDRTPEQQ